MRREKIFSNPYDNGHNIMFNNLKGDYTKSIGVPGKFVEKINPRVNLKNGVTGEMDSPYIADPDGIILHRRVASGLEHQSYNIDDDKLNQMGNYQTHLVVETHLPTFLPIATHLDPSKSKKILKRSPTDIIELYFLDLGEKKITKKLSRVSDKINNNKTVSRDDKIDLGTIVLYAPRHKAREMTREVVNLYRKISNTMDFNLEYTLHMVITIMIDAYFDEKNEYEELINMLNNATSTESRNKSESELDMLQRLEWREEDLKEANGKLDTTTKKLNEANGKLDKANAEIARLKAENKKLKTGTNNI